jgi:glutamyl-tRNA synthetase
MGVVTQGGPPIDKVVALLKDRANTVVHLAENARMFYVYEHPDAGKLAELVTERIRPALKSLLDKLKSAAWERKALGAAVSEIVKAAGLKMPELAMPVRLIVMGRTQTPSLDAVLELVGREAVLARLEQHL